MAKSKYEYVKEFEVRDEVMLPNLIVVRVDGHDFRIFCAEHKFKRPNDEQALNLMNLCAIKMLKKFPEIVFSYGFSDEYSFIFEKMTKIHSRRASKLLSLIVSLFTSLYVAEWKEFFPDKELKYPPTFRGKVIPCATVEVLQHYLAWRQTECHMANQYNSCLWELIEHGMLEKEAHESLKGTNKEHKNELLFQRFGVNYKSLPQIFRQGSCVFKEKVVHSKNIAGKRFWNEHPSLLKDLGDGIAESIPRVGRAFLRSFEFENKLLPSTWIVVRVDGHHFHNFSDSHEFEKPNDKQALKLMNVCAVAVLLKIEDVIFAYGQSDEYSFILKKDTRFYQRKSSNVVSVILSLFTATYTMKWKTFFPQKELQYPPSFDGRAVCYPDTKILHDYLAWRQVDCHINNLNNTCFWLLVKSGKSMKEANLALKSTLAKDKCELLAKQYGIVYNTLPPMFRWGSSVFWEDVSTEENRASNEIAQRQVVVKHCDIIQSSFWEANPSILA
ncbi:hypothetical protein Drorol1_Dr00023639 [Drosera rotundifolia]